MKARPWLLLTPLSFFFVFILTAPSAHAVTFSGDMEYGSSGLPVTQLQNVLIGDGYLTATATGFFGTATRAAVEKYQSAHGISPTGYVGSLTRSSLNGNVAPTTTTSATVGTTGMTIPQLEALLAQLEAELKALLAGQSITTAPVTPVTSVTSGGASSGGGGGGGGGGGSGGGGGGGGSVSTALPAPTLTLNALPTSVISGASTTLTWSTTNASNCSASGSWSGAQGLDGSVTETNLTATSTYSMTCNGAGGSATQSVTVGVTASSSPASSPTPTPTPTVTISASPTSVTSGGSSTLTWSSTNATSCTASGAWSGSKATSGTAAQSNITNASTYTLACTGAGGTATSSASVTVTAASSGSCSTDGSSGAPSGVIARNPSALSGYAYAPTCKYADIGYGVGAEGLGPQVQTTSQTTTSSNVLHVGSTPSYIADGDTIIDITNSSAIAPGTTISSFDGSGNITMSANAAGTVANGDIIGFFESVDNWTPPAGCTKNTTSHQLFCSGNNITLSGGIDFSPDGGWKLNCYNGGNFSMITNTYWRTGSNEYDALDFSSSCTGATLTGNTFDGNKTTDANDTSASTFYAGSGTYLDTYNLYVNAFTDFTDLAEHGSFAATVSQKFDAMENNGYGITSGAHPDWVQGYANNSGCVADTFQHNNVMMTISGLGTRGITYGDTPPGCYPNPVITDNLFFLPAPASGGSVQEIAGGDMSQVTGTYTFTNNFIMPTDVNTGIIYTINSGATMNSTGNINIQSGQSCNGPASTGSGCSSTPIVAVNSSASSKNNMDLLASIQTALTTLEQELKALHL